MGAQRRQCCATFAIETRTRNAVVERRRWKGEELFGYSKVELLSLLYSPQRYRSMVKTRDVNERRYGDTVSRDSAIAIHILNLSYLTISNLRIGEICADRIFFHPSIHAIFNNTNATTLPRNSNAILAIFPSPARRIRIFSRSEVRRKRKGRGCITR